MKRKIAIIVGTALLGLATYVGSQLWAQTPASAKPAQPAAPLNSKIALLNLSSVVKHYDKWTNFQKEMKDLVTNYENTLQAKKTQVETLQKGVTVNTDTAQKDQVAKQLRTLQGEMQEISEEAKQKLARREGDMLVIIYKEVQQAVEAYSTAYQIELVMHFNDAISKDDMNNPANVQRKMTTGACMPLLMDPRMDITEPVTKMLNDYYKRVLGAAPAPAAPSKGN